LARDFTYPEWMLKKLAVIMFILGILVTAGYYVTKIVYKTPNSGSGAGKIILSPFANANPVKSARELLKEKSVFGNHPVLNVLLIGTDTSLARRQRGQFGFNTDSLVLVSVNPEKNTVLLTSVPRDLWINGNKINALYALYGWESLRTAFEQITGQKIDGYIVTDFDGFTWIVDSFGGTTVEIKNTFTDVSFPNPQDSGVIPVSFTTGEERMTGERALIYARSRKGNNGEGSDLMRAKRQHLILQGMIGAIGQPASLFQPMNLPKFYEAVTQHMETSLSLDDVYYLWDFYKDRDKYKVESFVIGDDYLYYPGMYPESPYRAWVFLPRDNSFSKLQADISAKIDGTFISSAPAEAVANQ
jgi:LCP family protein required for cell wall assembly